MRERNRNNGVVMTIKTWDKCLGFGIWCYSSDNSGDVPKATRRGYWKVQVVVVVDANADAG